jgi:GntR family transcriptional regulator
MGAELDLRVDRRSGEPLGAQLAGAIRAAIDAGELGSGDRLPSVRELAHSAGVNVNTARSVYARLEADGVVRSEHGRGTFVASPGAAPSRAELREQIAALEASLARLPPPPLGGDERPRGAALPSTEELVTIRDRLVERLVAIETERAALLRSLDQLGLEARAEPEAQPATGRRATASLAGARIRWVGA